MKSLAVFLLLLTGCFLIGCQPDPPAAPAAATPPAPATPGHVARALIVTSAGQIEVELYTDQAPRTVANFIALVKQGFYTGLIFHRVANLDGGGISHVIQAGGFDQEGRQKPSPLGQVPLEISPSLTHVNGALAMARGSDPNSASSQFYICDGPHPFLDRNYAVFGKVTQGMDIVRAIATAPKTNRGGAFTDLPVPLIVIREVRIISE
ncbi:MAG TPA: peptidylprolyl isomerase [bacterium]|nr:peptidylprolyl isomerase [bacterium]